jgi:hypothetical protein
LETVSLFRAQAEPMHLLALEGVTSNSLDSCVAAGMLVTRGRTVRAMAPDKSPERAELCEELAVETALVDRWEESTAAREEALGIWRALGDDFRAGRALRMLSTPYWRLCRCAESTRVAQDAVAVLETLPEGEELGWRGSASRPRSGATASSTRHSP